MRVEARVHRDNWDQVAGFLQERVAATRVVKSFNREATESALFATGIEADYTNFSKIVLRTTRLGVIADGLGSLGGLIVLGRAAHLFFGGQRVVITRRGQRVSKGVRARDESRESVVFAWL